MATQFIQKIVSPVLNNNESDSDYAAFMKVLHTLKIRVNGDIESDKLAGNLLYNYAQQILTSSVGDYLRFFKESLDGDVHEFISKNIEDLEVVLSEFRHGPEFAALISRGYLAILRYLDTYLNKSDKDEKLESIEHFYMRLAVFFSVQTLKNKAMYSVWKATATFEHIPRFITSSHQMKLFLYYFYYLSTQTVCCSTPIMRNAGTKSSFFSSCFLVSRPLSNPRDVSSALFQELNPLLMKGSGVGLNLTPYCEDKEILHVMKLVNSEIEYHNDLNVRPVSVAAFMELWHKDVFKMLHYKLPENDSDRCKSMFHGVMAPSYFFKLYDKNPAGLWHVFDPAKVNLHKLYGEEFEKEYERLVAANEFYGRIPLKAAMFNLIDSAVKTGSPYLLLKEACNEHYWKETQGSAINCSNLCAEVIQQCDQHTAICNLANVRLSACLCTFPQSYQWQDEVNLKKLSRVNCSQTDLYFSLALLRQATKCATFIINCAISAGEYPTELARKGAGVRSMGIGVQGLADVFAELDLEYVSPSARYLNTEIFENMYFSAVKTSMLMCKHGASKFEGFEDSKYATGWLHWHDWENVRPDIDVAEWQRLSQDIQSHGLYNSQFIALMPTAGSSQLTGASESYYPFFSNLSTKITNKTEAMRPNYTFWKNVARKDLPLVSRYMGKVSLLPKVLSQKYARFKTAFDYDQKILLDMARDRSPYVDQSQSHSIFVAEENGSSACYLHDLFRHGYQLGLKTLMYYCRVEKKSNLMVLQCLENETTEEEEVWHDSDEDTGDEPCLESSSDDSGSESEDDRELEKDSFAYLSDDVFSKSGASVTEFPEISKKGPRSKINRNVNVACENNDSRNVCDVVRSSSCNKRGSGEMNVNLPEERYKENNCICCE